MNGKACENSESSVPRSRSSYVGYAPTRPRINGKFRGRNEPRVNRFDADHKESQARSRAGREFRIGQLTLIVPARTDFETKTGYDRKK